MFPADLDGLALPVLERNHSDVPLRGFVQGDTCGRPRMAAPVGTTYGSGGSSNGDGA